jgi:hypothetical protein
VNSTECGGKEVTRPRGLQIDHEFHDLMDGSSFIREIRAIRGQFRFLDFCCERKRNAPV